MSRLSIALLTCSLVYCSALSAGTAYVDNIFGVAKTSNIIYGTGAINNGSGSTNLRLDLYRPTDIGQGALPATSPAIVLIHGGGFTSGSKNDLTEAA
jgi:acetyl esterase/lipase